MKRNIERSALQAALTTEAIIGEVRQGIDRAFDVIRHHTVHTKGYVTTAFKFIDEFGNTDDKAQLNDLLRSKSELLAVGAVEAPQNPAPSRPARNKK